MLLAGLIKKKLVGGRRERVKKKRERSEWEKKKARGEGGKKMRWGDSRPAKTTTVVGRGI